MEGKSMIATLLRAVLPHGSVIEQERLVTERYSLYLSQQSAHHHYDSLCLAMGVLEFDAEPMKQAEWLLRVEEAADKCAAAIEECTSESDPL
jgi:hypothetical protein